MILTVRPHSPEGYQERLLLASIIRRAAYDLALYKNAKKLPHRRIYAEAYTWMFQEDEGLHPDDRFTSFSNICMLLDQDPIEIRQKTLGLTRKDVKKYDVVDACGRI